MGKRIITSIIGIIIINSALLIVISNAPKKFMQDGVIFAVSIDGVRQDHFPTSNNYYAEINCGNDARGRWMRVPNSDSIYTTANENSNGYSYKVVVDKINNSTVECDVGFTSIATNDTSDSHFLNNTITSLITSGTSAISGNGLIVNESADGVGYRYEGKNPNNYIWFNNEMWRIIGLVPACTTDSCGNSAKNYVKIIKEEPIGGYAFNATTSQSDANTYSSEYSLYKILNISYLTKTDGTSETYCRGYKTTANTDCNFTEKGIGSSSYYGNMIQSVYWNTGKALLNVTPAEIFASESGTQTVMGSVGIMSASDYGYGSSIHNDTLDSYNTLEKTKDNWIFTGTYELTLTAWSSHTGAIIAIIDDGGPQASWVYFGYGIRPVVYLKESVYVVSGDGSEANPYQLGM